MESLGVEIVPVTPERWDDFERLMGERGGAGGCWCMLWRLGRHAWEQGKGASNRRAMRAVVAQGDEPGLLAYRGDEPIGWCSVAPRPAFPRLETSRILKPVDGREVWSVSCLLVDKSHRRQGVSVALLRGACGFVRARGGAVVEGYPVEPAKESYPPVYAWTGWAAAYRAAGFEEVARRSPTRPIMRKVLA